MAKPAALHFSDRIGRFPTVFRFLIDVARNGRSADVIYLTISESRLGNLKDLCIYLICCRRLQRMFIHLLGGAGMKRILERPGIQCRLNRFFISRLAGVIVEGRTQAATFSAVAARERIHIVPNLPKTSCFVTEERNQAKVR